MVYWSFFQVRYDCDVFRLSLQTKTFQPQSPTSELQQRILDATNSEAQGAAQVPGIDMAMTWRHVGTLHDSSDFS